jgi:hypothetical protein
VQVNAWLLEEFDPEAQPIEVIDGRTLWLGTGQRCY